MKHIYQDIDGWFSFPNLYSAMVKKFPSGGRFVEVGVYKGRSFSYLVVEAINSGKKFDLVAVDAFPWPGLKESFDECMKPLVGHYRVLQGGDSFDRAQDFEDGSIDFCFIDANHTYEFVKRDIEAYLPKMKKGGVLAGHDYNEHHPGVIKAVDEIFPNVKYVKEEDTWIVEL